MFWIAFSMIALCVGLIVMFPVRLFQDIDNAAHERNDDTNDPAVIEVSMEEMDKHFDRSAGRYCVHCGIHGSHHTDRHNDFAIATFAS